MASQAVVLPGATYIEPLNGVARGAAVRWRPTSDAPRVLRFSFQEAPPGDDDFWRVAELALGTWAGIRGLPFRFARVEDGAAADVEFRWVERFPTSQAGATYRLLDDAGFIVRATVVIARSHADGTAMSDDFRRLVALHEMGHVLGLPHSEDPGDAMHPGNRNLDLSARDLGSLRLLYPDVERP